MKKNLEPRKKMKTFLGIDIGPTSLGWALIDVETLKVIDWGVRIFPVGVQEDSYSKLSKEISKSAGRTQVRGARRLRQRFKLRRKKLIETLRNFGMMPDESMFCTSRQLYELRAKGVEDQISLKELGKIMLLLNKRRGFKSGKKNQSGDGDSKKAETETIAEMKELSSKIAGSGFKTIGAYFYSFFPEEKTWRNDDEPMERIRERFVYRKEYENEFDLLWEKQKEFYPDVLTEKSYDLLKKRTIFYQRPLKSQKHLVSKCTFENGKKAAPHSSFIFQQYRIWEQLEKVRYSGAGEVNAPFTIAQKEVLHRHLQTEFKLSLSAAKKLLNLPPSTKFNDVGDFVGNVTNCEFRKALSATFWDALPDKRPENATPDHPNFLLNKYTLWHTVHFAPSPEWLFIYALETLGFSDEKANVFAQVDLSDKYGSLSTKAMTNLIGWMEQGYSLAEARQNAGYLFETKPEGNEEKITITADDNVRNPLVQKCFSETVRLINAIITVYGKPDQIRVEMARDLKKPKDVRENMTRTNREKDARRKEYEAFLKEHFKRNITAADIHKFELFLELQIDQDAYDYISKKVPLKDFEKFCKKVSSKDLIKFRLWLEADRISPYTGKPIPLHKLFSPEIQIEHIVPYSRCMVNAFHNLTLSELHFNSDKTNYTPYEYFMKYKGEAEWKAFVKRVEDFPDAKYQQFTAKDVPQEFRSSDLNNTAYTARLLKKKLGTVCSDVRVTNGSITAMLRRYWGFNRLLEPALTDVAESKEKESVKNRNDHRHHAVDALVIALTTNRIVNEVNRHAGLKDGRLRLDKQADIALPEGYRLELQTLVNEIFVSFKSDKRLVEERKNLLRYHKHTAKIEKQRTLSPRASLHEESVFGQTDEGFFVKRYPIEWVLEFNKKSGTAQRLENVRDEGVRKVLEKHVLKYGQEAAKYPVRMLPDDESKIKPGFDYPVIKTVRCIDASIKNLLPIRKDADKNVIGYAESGNNYKIAIYVNPETGDRKYNCINFYEAASKKTAHDGDKENLFPAKLAGGFEYRFALTHLDPVVVYKNSPDEIDWDDKQDLFTRLYRLIQFDANGRLVFAKLNLAVNARTDANPIVIRWGYSTIKAVPVKITITGELIRLK